MAPHIKDFVKIKPEGGTALVQDRFATLEKFHALEETLAKFMKQPAIKEAIENHKSNWVANSKGGEPNHRP